MRGVSDIMAGGTGEGAFALGNDLNGNTTKLPTSGANDTIKYNWDNRMRSASKGSDSIAVKYDPMGNRVWRQSYDGQDTTTKKYVVDISGNLPTIIAEYSDPNSFTNSYVYADGQVLVQYAHSGDPNTPDNKYYYVHDRLGSVCLVVDCNMVDETVTARNVYTYSPFGNPYAGTVSETVYNPFQFTGQWFDEEINQYYLRARQYDPTMMRFMTRDPVLGEQQEPLTLHKYLYCFNEPVNHTDPSGRIGISRFAAGVAGGVLAGSSAYAQMINTGAYAAKSGNWKFFDMAFDIGKMMPLFVAGGTAVGTVPFYYKLLPNVTVTLVGEHMSGYDLKFRDNFALSTTRALFHMIVLSTRNAVGISDEEMADFSGWYNPD